MRKYLIKWLLIGIALIAVVVALYLGRTHQKNGICTESVVEFNVEHDKQFITADAILRHLNNNNFKWKNKPVVDIDLSKAEEILTKQPFIKEVVCYLDLRNRLVIEIIQQKPILRVFPKFGEPYYIDETGQTFPLSDLFSADVAVASGNITPTMNIKLYTLAAIVHQSAFWEPFIEHIFVEDTGDLVLTTQISGHQVIIGDPTRLESKLKKLETFYKKALTNIGWDQFNEINLEFKDQVICRK